MFTMTCSHRGSNQPQQQNPQKKTPNILAFFDPKISELLPFRLDKKLLLMYTNIPTITTINALTIASNY